MIVKIKEKRVLSQRYHAILSINDYGTLHEVKGTFFQYDVGKAYTRLSRNGQIKGFGTRSDLALLHVRPPHAGVLLYY